MKASQLTRPPLKAGNLPAFANPTPSSSTAGPQKGGGARSAQINSHIAATEQQQPPDCFLVYELFVASVTALISFFLVKDCNVVALNFRTFVSAPIAQHGPDHDKHDHHTDLHWLTTVNVHWVSSGTLLLSTSTDQTDELRCLTHVAVDEEQALIGSCVRVAPNASLATIASFDDPLDASMTETDRKSQRKRTKTGSVDHGINKWKSTVKRWLGWRGCSLDLEQRGSWVRLRIAHATQLSVTCPVPSAGRDLLWPRALCFLYQPGVDKELHHQLPVLPSFTDPNWFEAPGFTGFRDPLDVAQEWFLSKPNRDKTLDARRKAKKAEEETARRKDDLSALPPSSPLNARTGLYGELQTLSGVYPTPPDGIAPGASVQTSDTPSVSGTTSNVVLVSGGTNPTINLSAPQDHPPTSPTIPANPDNFHSSGFGDDLFEDMEDDGGGGHGINDADFDFFNEPDVEDVDMVDAPALPVDIIVKQEEAPVSPTAPESSVQEEASDSLAALESALAIASGVGDDAQTAKSEHSPATRHEPMRKPAAPSATLPSTTQAASLLSKFKEPTPPLSPCIVAKALRQSPPKDSRVWNDLITTSVSAHGGTFQPLDFNRRMSLVDAKYQEGRFATQHGVGLVKDHDENKTGAPCTKSLRDMPLMTKLRYAIGVASAERVPEVMSLARAASDGSDSSSETSDASGDESEDDIPAGPLAVLGRLIIPAKRKLPTESNATPLSATSGTESLGEGWQDHHGLQMDEAYLAALEPTSWDWPLVNFPPPEERYQAGIRYIMPFLPWPIAQLPGTPTSQSNLKMEFPDEQPWSGKDSIAITQIVTDQIISATLDVLCEDTSMDDWAPAQSLVEDRWQLVIKDLFPKAAACNLSTLAAVHDMFPEPSAQAKGQQRPLPRKPNEGIAVPGNHMYQINPPFVRVRRAETHWDLLPPAIAFWEPLGLAPVNAAKSVVAFCIYPHSVSLRPCLETFMLNMQLAFDSCKLGTHSRVETVIEYEAGLVPWKVASPGTGKDALSALKETCIQLGKLLAMQHAQIRDQQDAKIDAFVIYIIDPFGAPSALWDLCSSFWSLFQAYGQGPLGRSDSYQKPDLVLQVVPIKYIASFDCPVVLDPSTYISLAREVYERCPPSAPSADKSPLSIYTAPAFQLEEYLPRGIPFKLGPDPPQDLIRENSWMHVAYAVSLDGTWITAAWTDTSGKSQAVVSYHLGTRVFSEIATEMWQTTVEILQSRKVNWRVCLVRAGVMDREELDAWTILVTRPIPVITVLTLLTLDTAPPYKLTSAMPSTTSSTVPGATTPGSTPQAGVSPDPTVGLTPAATPSADTSTDPSSDPDARLIDVTDETWGVVLAHRLHNSNSTNQFCPALISGLLIKRGETNATSHSTHHPIPDRCIGPLVTAVNILWIGGVGQRAATSFPAPDAASPGGFAPASGHVPTGERGLMWTPTMSGRVTAENLMKEVLGQYRALGLLAKLKGVRGTRHGSVPWHVVAAQRGVKGLGRVGGRM
jgi:mediator of RNA polymerase II transcription subunit 13